MPLNVIIVGAGIAGLTAAVALHRAGHKVKIFEDFAVAAEIGAALNLAPNGTLVLHKLGFDFKRARAVQVQSWDTINGVTLETIASQDLSRTKERFGANYYSIHRVDLHTELMRLAAVNEKGGVTLCLSSRVARVDAKEGYVELQDGSREYGDLVIGADGIKSAVRQSVLGSSSQGQAHPTGLSAFRFLVPTEVFENNANARELMKWKNPGATLLGDPNSVEVHEERHLMWYPCRDGLVQNFVGIHPTPKGPVPDTPEGFKQQMLEEFGHFDPKIVELLRLGQNVKSWPLFQIDPLPTWIYDKVLLIGDAAHPMLPFGGQGSNQAIEDGGAIGVLLSNMNYENPLPQLSERLQLFERIRRNRASRVQILSTVRANREQLVEDQLKKYMEDDVTFPNSFATRVIHDAGFDVLGRCQGTLQAV